MAEEFIDDSFPPISDTSGRVLDLLFIFGEGTLRAPSPKINNRFEALPDTSALPRRDREIVRVILVGSQPGIETIIHRLHLDRFAEIREWSRLQPEPHSGKLMSVTTKSLWLN